VSRRGHYNQTEFATSLSRKFPLETRLQRGCSVSRHDGMFSFYSGDGGKFFHSLNLRGAVSYLPAPMLDSQHIHRSFVEDERGCCGSDTSRFNYLFMIDGCVVLMCWDPGGDRFGMIVQLDSDVLLHYSLHGEDYIRVA